MAEVTYDQIADAVVARILDQVPDITQVTYPAPEKPLAALAAWVEIGPTVYELGNLEIAHHQITVTLACPEGIGGYSGQVKAVHGLALDCLKAFRGDVAVGDEAILEVDATISKPFTGIIAGSQPVTAVTLTMFLQTLDDVQSQIAP